jgi:hypothetical protein
MRYLSIDLSEFDYLCLGLASMMYCLNKNLHCISCSIRNSTHHAADYSRLSYYTTILLILMLLAHLDKGYTHYQTIYYYEVK